MSKNNENKLVPTLRFPEFNNDGEWTERGIGDKFKFKQGVQVPVENQYLIYKVGLVRFIRIIDVTDKKEPHRYIENPGNEHLIGVNDLFMIRYGTPGVVSIGYEGVIANNLFRLMWKETDLFISRYWFYALQKKDKTILNLSGSSSMPAISFSTLESLNVQFPFDTTEQNKIAACLSALDEVITAENQKLDALEVHKKGLLQNLLPQEGETAPKFRFKEFEDSIDWEFEVFSEYIKLYRGSSPRPIQIYFTTDASGVNWIKIGDTKNADNFIINQVEERITPEGAEKSRWVDVGELILANSMSFGKTYQLAIEGYIYDAWFVLREYEEHFDKQFLLQLLNAVFK